MKIWKLSIGENEINDTVYKNMLTNCVVSVHPETSAKGQSNITQGENFLSAEEGDLFYVCRSNNYIAMIGMFKDERPLLALDKGYAKNGWIDREFILLFKAKNEKNYDKTLDKWWSPKNNSTFIEIPENEYILFEDKILSSVFDGLTINKLLLKRNIELTKNYLSAKKIQILQEKFQKIKEDPKKLFTTINNLNRLEVNKLMYEYNLYEKVETKPVVLLRKKLLQKLQVGVTITDDLINEIKENISTNFEKNVYKSWKDPFRILYVLYFAAYKSDLVYYLDRLIELIQIKLGISDFTDYIHVHFDGPQNQGYERIWFAIYNKTYKKYGKQKHAYQLFMSIDNGKFSYGLHHNDFPDKNISENSDYLCFYELVKIFKKNIEIIKNDNSEEKAMITEQVDLLENQKQIILQGPPGTGKTRRAKILANYMLNRTKGEEISENNEQIKLIQFHPSYTYEDFVRGIVAEPTKDKNGISYVAKNKILAEMAQKAQNEYDTAIEKKEKPKPYILIIDEINRANLSSVLGELIYALEYRNEAVDSMYKVDGSIKITLPANLYIIGTMNTADRSIGHIDYAIRRRFTFVDVLPDEDAADDKVKFKEVQSIFINEDSTSKSPQRSEFISPEFNPYHVMLGHSYFIGEPEILKNKLKYQVIPLLKEYISDGVLNEKAQVKIDELEKEL